MPTEALRRFGELKLKVGDLVSMNPETDIRPSGLGGPRGSGLAVITGVVREWERPWGTFYVRYVDDFDSLTGAVVMADDMTDILDVVNRA
jgi:hypothetical protein